MTGPYGALDLAYVEKKEHEATLDEVAKLSNEDARCPKCGDELITSFGLAFGGYGPMVMCNANSCDFVRKHDLGPDSEA